jgi:hypothetical protein
MNAMLRARFLVLIIANKKNWLLILRLGSGTIHLPERITGTPHDRSTNCTKVFQLTYYLAEKCLLGYMKLARLCNTMLA